MVTQDERADDFLALLLAFEDVLSDAVLDGMNWQDAEDEDTDANAYHAALVAEGMDKVRNVATELLRI